MAATAYRQTHTIGINAASSRRSQIPLRAMIGNTVRCAPHLFSFGLSRLPETALRHAAGPESGS